MGKGPALDRGEGLYAGCVPPGLGECENAGRFDIELEPRPRWTEWVPRDHSRTRIDERAAVQTDQVCGRQAFDRGPATIGDIDVDNQAIGLLHVTEQLHGRGKMMLGELSGQ